MRPTRLQVQGFTAFRDPTEVDFTDAELFALTGPTGAGKSSLIDAMVFALYGSVPRLDRKAVAPIVSLGRNETRVRLDFTVAGVPYTAARVVRRTRSGATTKEARLESGGEVLAGNEKELTEAVERLLGLNFEHFTTCVVLPQGRFMKLLHATGGERQDLLVSLLDLGLFERMARLAAARERADRQRAEVAGTLLAKLGFATDEALAAAASRVDTLTALRAEVDAAEPEMARLREEQAAAEAAAALAAGHAELLAAVAAPLGLGDHAVAVVDARDRAAEADAEVERSVVAVEQADQTLAKLPARAGLEGAAASHAARARHHQERAAAAEQLAGHEAAVGRGAAVLAAAEADAAAAAAALDRAQWEHRAHDLAGSLVVGEACPVCRQVVGASPERREPADLEAGRQAKAAADSELAEARAQLAAATRQRDRAQAALESIDSQLADLDAALVGWPAADAIAAQLAEVTEAEATCRLAAEAASTARRQAVLARQACQEAEGRDAEARRAFDAARDRVAALGPPAAERRDVEADWTALVEWARARRPEVAAAAAAAARAAAVAVATGDELRTRLAQAAAHAGVRPERAELRGPVAHAQAKAQAELDRVDRAQAEAAEHRAEHAGATRAADVAKELARLLNANHFEKWVLDEALAVLVEGATEVLLDLSAGSYSLGLDDRSNFLVVDHRNADEVRPARTLSGGETFLASLALALALADQIGGLAASGSARLESIFLDEGFGSLDPDTLDTVAAAIEELGSRDRMVGLISHVAELAERVPVRFEVTKGPSGSSVSKVVT